jgi:hypothetical protein
MLNDALPALLPGHSALCVAGDCICADMAAGVPMGPVDDANRTVCDHCDAYVLTAHGEDLGRDGEWWCFDCHEAAERDADEPDCDEDDGLALESVYGPDNDDLDWAAE